jgi:hypothetical protein
MGKMLATLFLKQGDFPWCEVHFFRPLKSSYLSQSSKGTILESKLLFHKEFVNTSKQHLTKKVNSELLLLFLLRINNLLNKVNKTGTKGLTF